MTSFLYVLLSMILIYLGKDMIVDLAPQNI